MKGELTLSLAFLLLMCIGRSQDAARQNMLDSLNKTHEKDRGAFNLYIKKPQVEIIAGGYRNRTTPTQGLELINFTYHISLPFQFDLNYVNLKAKDKLLKLNTNLIVHHSKYGNYALGLGERFSFLLFRRTYLSYQVGLVWCENVKNSDDGINDMGFSLHHVFSITHHLSEHVGLSANAIHLSSAALFPGVNNNQDVIGLGISYQF